MYLITNSANLIAEICEHPCYVRRQANGVVVLSEQDKADAIYSNDSNTFWKLSPASTSTMRASSTRLRRI